MITLARLALPASLLVAALPLRAREEAVFAGGCFWGVEAVYEHLRGVESVTSGYAVPRVAAGEQTSAAHRGPAEAVRVVYDPAQVTYQQLLEVFFLVAHDPTQVDRQGPDIGPRYRSIVFVDDDDRRRTVLDYIDSLRARRVYPGAIVTAVTGLRSFQVAEGFHQDFVARHPRDAYVVAHDVPKLAELRRRYPDLYRDPRSRS